MKAFLRVVTVSIAIGTTLEAGTSPAPTTARSATRPSGLQTQEDIRALVDQKKFEKAVTALNAALAAKGAKASEYDRYDLLMLKGDSHLGLSQFKSARDAFSAACDATTDAVKAATARSTIRLVIEVKGPVADQKLATKGAKPRDPRLLDADRREESFKLLLGEVTAVAKRRSEAAKTAKTIPPIIDALDALALKYDLELATGGKGEADRAAFTELSGVARDRMRKELNRMRDVVTKMTESATEEVGTVGPTTALQRPVYRGVSGPESRELMTMADTTSRILNTTAMLARGAGADAEVDGQLLSDGKELAKYIRALQAMPRDSNGDVRSTPASTATSMQHRR